MLFKRGLEMTIQVLVAIDKFFQFTQRVDSWLWILVINSFDVPRKTIMILEITSLGLGLTIATDDWHLLAVAFYMLQMFFASFQKSLIAAAEYAGSSCHSTFFNMTDVAIEREVLVTVLAVAFKQHFFVGSLIQCDPVIGVKEVFSAGRAVGRVFTILFYAGDAKVLSTLWTSVLARSDRNTLANEADELLRYFLSGEVGVNRELKVV